MGKINKQAGFSGVELVMALVIVILIAAVGTLVYKNHNKTTVAPVASANKTTSATPTPVATTPSAATDPYAGWTTYSSSYQDVSFKYPSSWKMSAVTNSDEISQPNEPYNQSDKVVTLTSPNALVLTYSDTPMGAKNECSRTGATFTAVDKVSITNSPDPTYIIESGNQLGLYSVDADSGVNQAIPTVGIANQCDSTPLIASVHMPDVEMQFATSPFFPSGTPTPVPANQVQDFTTAKLILASLQY